MVSAHDILLFEMFSLVFVRCTDNYQQLVCFYSFKCGIIQWIRTVIAQWCKVHVIRLLVVRLSLVTSRYFYIHF